MEGKSKEYLEKRNYIEEVYRARTFIIKFMRYFEFEFAEKKALVPKPDWGNRIKPNGAIGLVCWKNGLPMSLMTPWGEIRFVDIDKNGGFERNISEDEVEQFMTAMNAMFKLQEMAPGQCVHGFSCKTYSIQSFPWNHKYVQRIEMKNSCLGDSEELLLDTYKEGKQLCLDLFGRETAV